MASYNVNGSNQYKTQVGKGIASGEGINSVGKIRRLDPNDSPTITFERPLISQQHIDPFPTIFDEIAKIKTERELNECLGIPYTSSIDELEEADTEV